MIWLILLAILSVSCAKKEQAEGEDVLVRIGEKVITVNEVIDRIPVGLNPKDSAALFKSIVDSWIRDHLLVDFAESRLYDISSIERKVKEYRGKLIVMEYLARMRETHLPIIEEDKVKEYYQQNKKDLITERPLLKGIFLMINTSSGGKNEIKKLLSSDSEDNIDILEKNWLDNAIRYEYFKDKWIDWETISDLIPYRFDNPDLFLQENKYFEIDHNGCSYFLYISEYLPSGSEQPYEFAASWINDIISHEELAEYERGLVESLIKKSIDEKKLEIVAYDPLKHEVTMPE